jgi:hypothetical protein
MNGERREEERGGVLACWIAGGREGGIVEMMGCSYLYVL